MKKIANNKIEVDMIPLIDIISLLLMFLILVGDGAAESSSVKMKLPRADQAVKDEKVHSEGRLVVQLKPIGGEYFAIIDNHRFRLTSPSKPSDMPRYASPLEAYLDERAIWATNRGFATKGNDGAVSTPVKLRIPAAAPMIEVEKLVLTLASVGLVNVQFAADPAKEK